MENSIIIYGEQLFQSWLVEQNKASDEKRINDILDSLRTLYERVWCKIGDELKHISINSDEEPVIFDFNPFTWIRLCVEKKDQELLCDVVTLYSSILRRLFEKVNLDIDVFERNLQDGEPISFSRIIVGRYTWSDDVRKAYDKFEKTLPLPSLKMVLNWNSAWKLYVSFLNEFCVGLDLFQKSASQLKYYRNHYDPYGTDQRIRELDKEDRKQENIEARKWARSVFNKYCDEFLSLTLANSRNLKSVPMGIDKFQAIEWIDKGKCKVITTLFKPSVYSFKKTIDKIVSNHYKCIDFRGDVLIILYIEKDCDLQKIMDKECIKVSANGKSLKICVIRCTEGEGEGIYKIDICYR